MNIISCIDENLGIGYKNRLLYNIPQDMEFFKSKTTGKIVIMGRKTYQSLRVKPLPNRKNIVISHTKIDDDVITCQNKTEVLNLIEGIPTKDIFIIGGSSIYNEFLDFCTVAYITKVYSKSVADTFFPINLDKSSNWILKEKSKIHTYQDLKYSFNIYYHR